MIAASEYELLTDAAGLVERPARVVLRVEGVEAADFLQGQLTNDVEALTPGGGCYAAVLSAKGKLRADLRALRLEDAFLIDCEPIAGPVLRHMLTTYAVGRDVRFREEDGAVVSIIGPAARERLDVAPPEEEHAWVRGEHGLYVSTDLGVDVIGDRDVADALGVEAVSDDAAECLRIESGRPRLGRDMGSETIPEEADLNDRAVSFTKGCYVGQETVARLHYRGKPNRRLRGLRLSDPAEHGDPILLGEREVGKVGSASVSPRFGPIALAVVRREAAPGDTVAVNGTEAEVVELPFAAAG
jgi:tRNA-modifying protein YgfZ